MKKRISLLVFTHLVAVFMGIFVFYIVSNISENNTGAWYNGTIDLSIYNEIPEIRMMSRKFGDLDAIYLYPSDYIDEDGYLTKEAYEKIQYENLGVYSTPTEAQKAIVKLNNYFEKNSHKI